MSYSLNKLYQTIGISKQAVAQYTRRQDVFDQQVKLMLIEADELRNEHPGCGVEKMYDTLRPGFIGRDRFVELMMQLGYRLKKPKNYRRTTFSGPVYYPDLIQGLEVTSPGVVWQSDITYIQVGDSFHYAVFIMDVYTKIIVGHQVSDHMRATANLRALEKARTDYGFPQVHHSDRGSQYIYRPYVQLLKKNRVRLSMGLTAQENAYAERINRTIKEEYLGHWKPKTLPELKQLTTKAVNHYNTVRPHNAILKMAPVNFQNHWQQLKPDQRPMITIFDHKQS